MKNGLEKEVAVVTTGCNGFCERGPVMVVQPDNIFYQQLKEKDIPFLVEEHFVKGRPVQKLMYVPPQEQAPIPKMSDNGKKMAESYNIHVIEAENPEEAIKALKAKMKK